MNANAAALEVQEYLFADTAAENATGEFLQRESSGDHPNAIRDRLRENIREAFRFNRFAVMNWLLANGVQIPGELLSDQTHPPVGKQFPDRSNVTP